MLREELWRLQPCYDRQKEKKTHPSRNRLGRKEEQYNNNLISHKIFANAPVVKYAVQKPFTQSYQKKKSDFAKPCSTLFLNTLIKSTASNG